MSTFQVEIQLIAIITAIACAILGVFVILRRMAMMSDAISHVVLLGIVVGFFITQDLTSPVLIAGAALVGILTVSLVTLLEQSRLVKEDAAIGLVFPALFSLAVILISRYASDVHLDVDAVLVGELAFAPFDRFLVAGFDIGPRGLYLMGGILLIDLVFIGLFYKELKLSTFDAALAAALGFFPTLIHYGLMSLVSLTVVGAFDIVGSILVVALMVAPASAAYLLSDKLHQMLVISAVIGGLSAICGYWLAHFLDASIAGSITTMTGVFFLGAYLFAPERGILAQARRHQKQRWETAQLMLVIHLFNHEGTASQEEESKINHLYEHMRWEEKFASEVVQRAKNRGWILQNRDLLSLTKSGYERARESVLFG